MIAFHQVKKVRASYMKLTDNRGVITFKLLDDRARVVELDLHFALDDKEILIHQLIYDLSEMIQDGIHPMD